MNTTNSIYQQPLNAWSHCGVERWSVKTGSDLDVGLIDLDTPPTATTVATLVALPAPYTIPPDRRISPVETTVYQVQAALIGFKMDADSDYHLVLSDGGRTMIIEIPSPSCAQPDRLRADIIKVRSQFDARYKPDAAFRHVNVRVTVTGVGFFDFIHGQDGVAPNGIELHPVLSIAFE